MSGGRPGGPPGGHWQQGAGNHGVAPSQHPGSLYGHPNMQPPPPAGWQAPPGPHTPTDPRAMAQGYFAPGPQQQPPFVGPPGQQAHHMAPPPYVGQGQPYAPATGPPGSQQQQHQQQSHPGPQDPQGSHAFWQAQGNGGPAPGGPPPSVLQTYPPPGGFGGNAAEDGDNDNENEDEDVEGRGKTKQKGTSDFVKKLFKMLDDTAYDHIVGWGFNGDTFIVRDMNEFTKHVLPRHFRHSNFASFVRQLNKYDFHKVKNPEEQGQTSDQVWEFKHPDFIRGREDLLENVKRKAPSSKKKDGRGDSPTMPGAADAAEKGALEYAELKGQVAALTMSQDHMTSHINNLTRQYQSVIGEMLTFQRNMVQQDQLMQNLIQYLMNLENDRKVEGAQRSALMGPGAHESAFLNAADTSRLIGSYSDVARESFAQMSAIARRQSIVAPPGGGGGANGAMPAPYGPAPPPGRRDGTQAPQLQQQQQCLETGSRSSATETSGPLSPRSMASLSGGAGGTPTAEKGKGPATAENGFDVNGGPAVFLHPPHINAEDFLGGPGGSSGSSSPFGALANLDPSNPASFEQAGLRVFTVGTLQPRAEGSGSSPTPDGLKPGAGPSRSTPGGDDRPYGLSVPEIEDLPASMPKVDHRRGSLSLSALQQSELNVAKQATERDISPSPTPGSNVLRVRRSTYVPGWAVPPRVLVVDDDDVCRKLGSKFLQVFGCAIDVAVDGVTAVNKMNLEKYDLVLMDIVMPNLDGVSATSLIREFDPRTPIISMTSNSAPQELLSYMSSGMNDILPKPFTKEGLLNMLEKHLIHLKTVSKMDEIPKSIGLPPVSDSMLQGALNSAANGAGPSRLTPGMGGGPGISSRAFHGDDSADTSHSNSDEEEGSVNPLAGMGFSDEEYVSMLQNLLAAGSVSDSSRGEISDQMALAVGVSRGEGAGLGSKDNTPVPPGASSGNYKTASGGASSDMSRKRSARSDDGPEAQGSDKRSRFTELSA